MAYETHDLVANVYASEEASEEIVKLLSAVGFVDVRVLGGCHGGPPTDLDEFHVFVASAP